MVFSHRRIVTSIQTLLCSLCFDWQKPIGALHHHPARQLTEPQVSTPPSTRAILSFLNLPSPLTFS